VKLRIRDQELVLVGDVVRGEMATTSFLDAFSHQLDDFVSAILDRRQPFVSGREGRRGVDLIEACYAGRQQLEYPWMFENSA